MTQTKLTVKHIRDNLTVDTASIRNGIATVRRGFFYTGGRTAGDLVASVKAVYPDAQIVDSGEVWKPFRGGASTAQQSHWFVKFTL